MVAENRLDLTPVFEEDDVAESSEEFESSLSADGRLWIPAALRGAVGLGEQSVMMRFEGPAIGVFLRKVFETLGFGP